MTKWLLRLPVPLFAAGALFHVATLIDPTLGEPSPPWRHALFVGLNALYATLFALRPRWLALAYAPLAAQQAYSHGQELLHSAAPLRETQSLLALASIPLFLWLALPRPAATPP